MGVDAATHVEIAGEKGVSPICRQKRRHENKRSSKSEIAPRYYFSKIITLISANAKEKVCFYLETSTITLIHPTRFLSSILGSVENTTSICLSPNKILGRCTKFLATQSIV